MLTVRDSRPWELRLSGGADALRDYLAEPATGHRSVVLAIRPGDRMPDLALLKAACQAGLSELEAEFELAGAPEFAAHVRLLQDCSSLGLRVSWHAELPPDYPFAELGHLPPPRTGPAESPELRRWRQGWRYGLFYWRQGPGFVVVKDARPLMPMQRIVLDTPGELAAFEAASSGTPAASPDLEALVAVGIVLRHDGALMSLPYQVVEWPTPYMAI
ncbi:MAG: hypothetical protein JO144_09900 [Actinobacteria bacterium]|nr:hypothetical protein [Actinomycetota bacterium]